MLTIDSNTEIDAPIDLVWKKLAKLDDVQHWVTSVKSARYATEQTEGVGAERVCDVDGLGTLQETITDWRDGETLTYAVEGMPRIVKHVENQWRLEAITPERTRVVSQIRLEARYGAAGALFVRLMMKPQLGGFMTTALREFRRFVEESGTESDARGRAVQAHAQVA
jgi:hypothetical protein